MKTDTLNLISKILKYTLLTGAIIYFVVYLFLVYFRIQYPFELNWIEGFILDHVMRILSGQKIYISPSFEFIPLTYTPLYYYISAGISNIIGIGFLPLRLVSFVSSLACFFIIFLIVQRETGNKFSGILASCLFAATFRISGGYFDVARVDSLFLFFLLTALYLVKFATSNKSYILAGIFISLSFLTKQTALVVSLPIMLYCILLNRRAAFFFIGTIVVIIGGSTLIFNYLYDGWYNYYIYSMQGQIFTIIKRMFIDFWTKDIISPLPIASILILFYMIAQFLNSNKKNILFYFLISVGMLGGAWVTRLHGGGAANVLLPAYAVISILFGLALHMFFEFIQSVTANKQNILKINAYLFCILQFVLLIYNPLHQIPTKRDLEAGKKFINTIAKIKGEIYVSNHTYLSTMAGKKSYAHISILYAIIVKGNNEQIKNKLINEISQSIREKKFSAIIINSRYALKLLKGIEKYYINKGKVFDREDVFFTFSGRRTRPRFIYVPKNNDNSKTT